MLHQITLLLTQMAVVSHVAWCTCTCVTIHPIQTDSSILTWVTGTLINICAHTMIINKDFNTIVFYLNVIQSTMILYFNLFRSCILNGTFRQTNMPKH